MYSDIELIRCQFPFLDRIVTVHANTFHEHRTYRAREEREKEMIIYGRSKKDRKKESGVSVKKWGGKGNARETKTNQASVC